MGDVQFGIPLPIVLWLKLHGRADIFVETGTNQGASAFLAATHFSKVVTIEGYRPLYEAAIAKAGRPPNIDFIFGDSRGVLQGVVEQLAGPAIFWLDAHWCGTETFGASGECPVLQEISAINASPSDHVILVDDARLFLRPPPPPHRASDWPDLAQVCASLSPPGRPRCVAVAQDVIIAVPSSIRDQFHEYLRSSVPDQPTISSPMPRSSLKQTVQRVLKATGLK